MSIERPDSFHVPANSSSEISGANMAPQQKLATLSQEARAEVMSSTSNVSNQQTVPDKEMNPTTQKVMLFYLKSALSQVKNSNS